MHFAQMKYFEKCVVLISHINHILIVLHDIHANVHVLNKTTMKTFLQYSNIDKFCAGYLNNYMYIVSVILISYGLLYPHV